MQTKPKYKVLRVDLTNRETRTEELDESTVRKYLGGAGFSAKVLWDETTADTDPLSEDSPLIFSVGPVLVLLIP